MRLRLLTVFLQCLLFFLFAAGVGFAQSGQVSVLHYFADDMGRAGITSIFQRFTAEHQIAVIENPVGHEEFKTVALQMAAEGQLPAVVSYWAGARTQFMVDSGALAPLDELWRRGNFESLVVAPLADAATVYNGHRYLIPFGYHAVGFFYNPQLFKSVGLSTPPQTWDDFLSACRRLQQAGIPPLALGARNRWPAQFWFDYLLLRTAGPDFRQRLMDGRATYADPKVQKAMQLWAQLLENEFFAKGFMVDDWSDAADRVAAGRAGMTLMGTWISGYWGGKGLVPESGYDFFPFPMIDPQQPRTVIGPVDGMVMGATAPGRAPAEQLIEFLLTDLDSQQQWALAQGALSPNKNVPLKTYNSVLRKAAVEVEQADAFIFSYDLATPPPVAEQGLMMFGRFLDRPQRYLQLLRDVDTLAGPILKAAGEDRNARK